MVITAPVNAPVPLLLIQLPATVCVIPNAKDELASRFTIPKVRVLFTVAEPTEWNVEATFKVTVARAAAAKVPVR